MLAKSEIKKTVKHTQMSYRSHLYTILQLFVQILCLDIDPWTVTKLYHKTLEIMIQRAQDTEVPYQ